MNIYTAIFLAFVASVESIKNGQLGIIDGTLMYPHSRPYMVFLSITGSATNTRCGATLISENYVLTAARCLKDATSVKVVLGADNITIVEETQVSMDTTQSNFLIHEEFNQTSFENNIALIKLPNSITTNDYIQIAPVAKEGDVANYTDKMVITAGWGITYYGYPDSVSDVPQAIWLDVLEKYTGLCHEAFGDQIKDTNICCSSKNSWDGPLNLCDGDWGGPLVVDGTNLLVGVASFTSEFGNAKPNVFTDVTKYTNWLATNSDVK